MSHITIAGLFQVGIDGQHVTLARTRQTFRLTVEEARELGNLLCETANMIHAPDAPKTYRESKPTQRLK